MKKSFLEEVNLLGFASGKSWEEFAKNIKIKNKSPVIISICQNKGGVGKTTATLNLGYLFSQTKKTLLIDLDSQANLSQVFEIFEAEYFLKDILDNPKLIDKSIINTSDNLSIIPNSINFDAWKNSSVIKRNVQYFLSRAIKEVKDDYDIILIDCPPSIDLPFELALNASDYAFILMDGHKFSLDGLGNILAKISSVIDEDITGEVNLKILGLAFTRYKDTILINQVIDQAKQLYQDSIYIFENKIREGISIPESQALNKNIFQHDENSNASLDYFKLWYELVGKIYE